MKYELEIATAASKHGLDPLLVGALVDVESGRNRYAWNPEPRYRYLWDVRANKPFRRLTMLEEANEVPPKDFSALMGDKDQEWWAQQASWGLMQVMGALARELGFTGHYLTELLEPTVCLSLGCAHLSKLITWSRGNTTQALAAYNGGRSGNEVMPFRNIAYAQKVLRAQTRLT